MKTWFDAKTFCAEKGGSLATVTSQEVNVKLHKLLKKGGWNGAWIGYNDLVKEGKWSWQNKKAGKIIYFVRNIMHELL